MFHRVRFLCLSLLIFALGVGLAFAADPAAKNADPATKKAESAKKQKKGGKKTTPAAEKKAEPATEKKAESADKKEKKAEEAAAPACQPAKKSLLKITVELEGVFEGETAQEVALTPEEWPMLTVVSAVAHGARVRKGDVLLRLETEKLDRAIADFRAELKTGELALRQNHSQLESLEKVVPLELESSQRAARVAEEDLKNFLDVERPAAIRIADYQLKMAKTMLEYEEEELRQLEKMYKADDITEETEEIVLKRAHDNVDRAKFMVEMTEIGRDQALKFEIPRREEQVKDAARRRSLEWEKNKVDLPLALQRQRLEMEKLRTQRGQMEEKLKRLLADRELMTVKATADGIVYYGKLTRGRPSDATALGEMFRPHGGVPANQVVMTVVQPRPMCIRATLPEAQMCDLRPGVKGTATPAGYPDVVLPVALDTASDIPTSPGSFEGRLTVTLKGKTKLLMPGMTCKIKLVPCLKTDALCVPPSSIVTDDVDEQKQSVQVLEKDGKVKSRPVVIGRKTDKLVEILQGLSEGEKVVTEPAKDKK
jgi:HlyD family secretion protein